MKPDSVQDMLKGLKRELGRCEDEINMRRALRKSLLRQINECREDDHDAYVAVFGNEKQAE
jgi:hypothetical protein